MTREEEIRAWMNEHYVQVSMTVEENYERIKAEFLEQKKTVHTELGFEQNGMCGLKDYKGDILLPAEYDDIRLDYSETALSSPCYIMARKGKWGIVDNSGNILLPFKYDDIYPIESAEYAVKQRGKWGAYSVLHQEWLLRCSHDTIYSNYPSPMELVLVFSDNGKFGWTGCQFPKNNSKALFDAVYLPQPSYFYSPSYDEDTEVFEARIGKEWYTIESWTIK